MKKNAYFILKRIFDLFFALILFIITSPILVIIALLIKLEDPTGPIFFRQKRLGLKHKEFFVYKFRSMITKMQEGNKTLTDSDRILKIGNIIRKLSFDELPQIFNVIKGEMSFIGPRPLSFKYLDYYTFEELHRHDIRPGLSGWAQVNGRNNLTWDRKFELDLFYVHNIGLKLDLKIFFMTIKKVLMRSDAGLMGTDFPAVSLYDVRQKRVEN